MGKNNRGDLPINSTQHIQGAALPNDLSCGQSSARSSRAIDLRDIEKNRKEYKSGDTLVWEGEGCGRRTIVRSGWAACQRITAFGRRQIIGLALSGDALSSWTDPCGRALVTVVALTPLVTSDIAETVYVKATAEAESHNKSLLLDHVMRLGCLTAFERVVHLFLEFRARLAAVGLADDVSFHLPLSQEVLADILGISIVHMNRILQQLRREKLIVYSAREVMLLDRRVLELIAEGARTQRTLTLQNYGTRGALASSG